MIPFTDRELRRAWRENRHAGQVESKRNPHRLLIFYAVECGLKALVLKEKRKTRSDDCPEIQLSGHNINQLLDQLRAGGALKLPKQMSLDHIRSNSGARAPRTFSSKDLNQVWRYGGCCSDIPDAELEDKLHRIIEWIEGRL